jgi:SNF2 family DNA or RNA helicase
MMQLTPEQIEGAKFLAERPAALLADEPGFGKSAQAIAACDRIGARNILVITTASARINWLNEFKLWSDTKRDGVAWLDTKTKTCKPGVTVVAWSNVLYSGVYTPLSRFDWDVVILDESHYAKNITAKRTKIVYGHITPRAKNVWCLTGTPIPNAPNDLYPMLRACFPKLLEGASHDSFIKQFCITQPRYINGQLRDIIVGGKNMNALGERLRPVMLRRKTEGLPPIRYSVYALHSDTLPDESDIDVQAVLEAAQSGSTNDLDLHLGTIRRATGVLKARAAAALIAEELQNGLDKIVLFGWHREALDILAEHLAVFNCARIDGATHGAARQAAVEKFQKDKTCRVFIGQIQAAGEAITLTAAAQVLFVETSFIPKDMAQAVRRILRRGQTRPCLCRIAALSGSIDEALMRIVQRKVETIRAIID